MKQYFGNHLGMVINNADPEYRGRVQVFVPHIMPALYDGWNKEGVDIQISCVGSNIPEGLTPEIHAKLVKILPWAEAASPIIGSSAPGNLFSSIVAGAAAGAATGGVIGAVAGGVQAGVNHFYNQGPTSNPVEVEGGDAQGLINKAKGITGLSFDGSNWGKCARGTTGLDKAAGLIDNNGASAGFFSASDLAAGGTNETGYNPYTQGTGAKYFRPPFTINTSSIKKNPQTGKTNVTGAQVGDSVYSGGGGGEGHGHAQKLVGIDKNGDQVWVSDNPQKSGFFSRNKTADYTNFTVYRLNDEGLAKYTQAIGGKVTGQSASTSTGIEPIADATAAAPNPLTNKEGIADASPVPQTNMVAASGQAGMIEGGTLTGGGTESNVGITNIRTQYASQLNDTAVKERFYALMEAEVGSQGAVSQQAFAETVFNRAYVQKESINSIISNERYYEPYQNGAFQRASARLTPTKKAQYDQILQKVQAGSNLTNGATHNASAGVAASVRRGGFDATVGSIVEIGGETFYSKDFEQTKIASLRQGLMDFDPNALPNQTSLSTAIVNNTDSNGRTPILNSNDMASGMFAYPNPGAMVWVFFREGNPLFPVYFAASYSSAEWQSAYRHGSEAELMSFDDPNVRVESSILKPSSAFSLLSKKRVNLTDPLDNESVAMWSHEHGSNITMKDGCDFFYSRNNKRDEVDNDRHIVTKGYKEEWVEADESKNVRGDVLIKIGNISAEAIAAMEELSNMSYEMNQKLLTQQSKT